MFLITSISRLPFRVLYALSDCLFFVLYYVLKYRREVVKRNLVNAFPEKSTEEIGLIAKEFYRNLTDVIVETVKALTISDQELNSRIHVLNFDACMRELTNNQSIIVMASHQANWEWLQLVFSANLAKKHIAVDAVYKPLHNQFSERLMLAIRTRFGSYPLPMNKLPREIVSRRPITRIIAMVADQMPAPETAYWTQFLNQDTPFFTGAAKIAQRTGYPVFYVGMRRIRRGYYEVYAHPLKVEPVTSNLDHSIIEAYVQEVEKAIKLSPAQWLWSHKRWKHKRAKTIVDEGQ
ncbi:lysophospholipid acyltransferase family protein [Rhodocytophaga aerolata]|uniref:Lysophospholipid acyltransferase family protein n=1 Tax=Rhodocytophaga aerolata TaxID=455078 RepID=A0ABT8RGM2_9BACT|nr:lysophospholipid acyltransferase family protein [Rhodocytophaga aerolata]MDO1450298.1 lysophospholipid acyltransferase family protein [Rhodocytophaga aerolata]